MAEKNGHGGVCTCMGCPGYGRHWTFFLLRTILAILILMMVFWFGVQVGRLSSFGGGRFMMMRGDYSTGAYGTGSWAMPMMPVRGATSTPTTGGVQNY